MTPSSLPKQVILQFFYQISNIQRSLCNFQHYHFNVFIWSHRPILQVNNINNSLVLRPLCSDDFNTCHLLHLPIRERKNSEENLRILEFQLSSPHPLPWRFRYQVGTLTSSYKFLLVSFVVVKQIPCRRNMYQQRPEPLLYVPCRSICKNVLQG